MEKKPPTFFLCPGHSRKAELLTSEKNAPPPIPSSTQKAYLISLFKAITKKYIFMESLNTSKYIHYVHSDIAMKDTI